MKSQTVRPYLIMDTLDAQIPMVMMLHTFENTIDRRLRSFGKTAGKLVPVENFYKDAEATKRIKFYVFQLIIKEVFWARQIRPRTSPYAGSSN